MTVFVKCGKLFNASTGRMEKNRAIEIAPDGTVARVADPGTLPIAQSDTLIDHSGETVIPGLIDIHVHLSYGNARTEEDIDLFGSVEFRALRGLHNAQRVMAAGFTSIADPATTGRVSAGIRDAINANLFQGPRITTAGRQITNRQGISDWYPAWIGVPETSVGVLVTDKASGIEEVRRQTKDGVDFIKIALDGITMHPADGLVAGFTQDETTAIVEEAHRLGRKVVVHARGAQAVLYAARAKVDVIFHASWMDSAGLDAVLENNCLLCPSLTFPANNVEFSTPTDPSSRGMVDRHRRELDSAVRILSGARKAGAKFLVGSDSGFAVTPYGEWHARELQLFVEELGFSPADALQCATLNNAGFLREHGKVGMLEQGRYADFVALKRDPLENIRTLQDKANIAAVYKDGRKVRFELPGNVTAALGERSYSFWNDVHTQDFRARLHQPLARSASA